MEITLTVPRGTDVSPIMRHLGWEPFLDREGDEGDEGDEYLVGEYVDGEEERANDSLPYPEALRVAGWLCGYFPGAYTSIQGNGGWADARDEESEEFREGYEAGEAARKERQGV